MRRLSLLLALALAAVAPLSAENWPNWRGPASTGVSPETSLPVRWSDTENIAWKASIRGLGISSPIVWGNSVFVTSQVGSGVARTGPRLVQGEDAAAAGERALGGAASGAIPTRTATTNFLVSAFDKATGKTLWEYELPSEGSLPEVHEKHNLATPSPVTDGERVYAWFGTGQIIALDMSGKLVWKRNLSEYGSFGINWGHGSSPIVYKDTLILLCYHNSPASYILAVNSATGANKWKADSTGSLSYSTPFVIETSGGPELIVNSGEGISAHSLTNGEKLWYVNETNRFPIPVATQQDGIILLSRGYRSGPYMAIRPGGKGDVAGSHVVWKVPTGAPYISSIIQYDGLIYMIGDVGVATVVDAKTGARVWQERIGGVYSASPIAGDGKVYFFSENGETIVLSAGRAPDILARNKIDGRVLGSPAISGGRMFIRSDNTLFAIGK
ncbi:MAG TPA: PQQ-binding-like beta-propeller repeat protein [Terriglobia bacterium]|nr:PQQ-binding-like beta-propeller repeat protein [Terriglobia bacterium]